MQPKRRMIGGPLSQDGPLATGDSRALSPRMGTLQPLLGALERPVGTPRRAIGVGREVDWNAGGDAWSSQEGCAGGNQGRKGRQGHQGQQGREWKLLVLGVL